MRASSPGYENTPTSVLSNPLVLAILITETAERVAYFGFRAELVLYLSDGLRFSESTSVALCSATAGLAYLSPFVGAVLADSSWGRFKTIWRFGATYALGLCFLTWAAFGVPHKKRDEADDEADNLKYLEEADLRFERALTFVGLFLVCMGTGGIKPCVSAFGADQIVGDGENSAVSNALEKISSHVDDEPVDATMGTSAIHSPNQSTDATSAESRHEDKIREYFNSFYFCINVGALGAFAFIPIIRAHYGFGGSFLVPTLSMIFALLIFRSQRLKFRHYSRDESQPSLLEIFTVCIEIVRCRINRLAPSRPISQELGLSIRTTVVHSPVPGDEDDFCESRRNPVYRDAAQSLHLLPLMAFFPIFWMLYDQQGSVWTLQATRMDLHGVFTPEQLQFLNPLEIMIFIPLFDKKIYPWLQLRGWNLQPLRRMEYGMFLTFSSFTVSAVLEHQIRTQRPMSISVAWQLPQITLLTIGEILLYVTALEFSYSQAPQNMQALILALYLSTTAIGDGIAAFLYGIVFSSLPAGTAMVVCAVCMILNLFFFSRIARNWTPFKESDGDGREIEFGALSNA